MANKEVKAKFAADTKGFTDEINRANSELTKLRSEMRLVDTQAKSTGDTTQTLADKQRILATELQASQTKVDNLAQKLNAAKTAFGENSVEVQRLETQLNNARTAHEKIAQQAENVAQSMQKMETETRQAESAMRRLESTISGQESELSQLRGEYANLALEQGKSSTEARQMAQRIEDLSNSLRENKSRLDDAKTAADQLGRSFDSASQDAKELSTSIGDIAAGNILADGFTELAGSLVGLEGETRQYRNEQNKLEAVAKNSGQSLDALKGSYKDLYAITGDETLASTAVLNMSAMGMSVADQESLINSASGAWAAYGDSIPLDGLLESINETSRAGQVTGSFADALNWANMSNEQWSSSLSGNSKAQAAFNKAIGDGMSVEDAFNEALKTCTTTQERQKLITDAMNGAYGQLGQTYQQTNADVIAANEAQSNLNDAMGMLGEAVAPITTEITNLIANGLQWLATNLPTLAPIIAGVAAGFGAFLIISQVVLPVMNFVRGLQSVSQLLMMLTNPVGIAVAAIALLVAGFVALYQNNEQFRNAVNNLWTTLQTVFGQLAEWFMTNVLTPLMDFFNQIRPQLEEIWNGIVELVGTAIQKVAQFITENMDKIKMVWDTVWNAVKTVIDVVWPIIQTVIETALGVIQGVITTVTGLIEGDWSKVWEGIKQIASSVWEGIKQIVSDAINAAKDTISNVLSNIQSFMSDTWNNVKQACSDAWNNIKQAVSDGVNNVIDAVRGIPSKAASALSGIGNTLYSAGRDLINGLKRGVTSAIESVVSAVRNGVSRVVSAAKGLLGIASPSKVFAEIGEYTMQGLAIGIDDTSVEAVKSAQNAVSDVMGNALDYSVNARIGGYEAGIENRIESSLSMGDLVSAIQDLADRTISLEINGKQLMRAVAADGDKVNGSRQALLNRGVSL